MTRRYGLAVAAIALAAGASTFACGAAEPPPPANAPIDEHGPRTTNVEIAELEISEVGSDRFVHCPPPGEIGQKWIPAIPPWTPAASPPAEAPTGEAQPPSGALGIDAAPPTVNDVSHVDPTGGRSRTERAVEGTRADFRRCYRRGLLYDPTQDGHVAIVLRVAGDGAVQQVESYGACDLASDAVQCMKETASTLKFEPSPAGADTIVVPVVFTGQHAQRTNPLPTDAYAADCYIALEQVRPALHACLKSIRQANKSVFASASFTLDIDHEGTVQHTNLDPWTGDQDLLACAADAMVALKFPPPPAGQGRVLARINFNPRPGTR